MNRAYVYRLKPNKDQINQLLQRTGAGRKIWNHFLDLNIKRYELEKKFIFYNEMAGMLPALKEEFPWLKEVPSQALQQRLKDLDKAIKSKFKSKFGFPKFKSKHHKSDTLRIPQTNGHIKQNKKKITIPKMEPIKWIRHRNIQGELKSITIKQNLDKWDVICLCELPDSQPLLEVYEDEILGIDLGLIDFGTCTDGIILETKKFYRDTLDKLKHRQRRVSKAKKTSNRRKKQKKILAKIHKKVANQRKNFLHKESSAIAKHYKVAGLEDLNITGMLKQRNLAKSISDQGWNLFGEFLSYKLHVVWVDRWYPSTKTCCVCGEKHNLTLDQRTYICSSCGNTMPRDLNASYNILKWTIDYLNRTGAVRIKGRKECTVKNSDYGELYPVGGSLVL